MKKLILKTIVTTKNRSCERVFCCLKFFDFILAYANFLYYDRDSFRAASLEFLDAAGGIDQFVFTGIEWMALRADFNFNFRLGGSNRECIAAGATHLGIFIICRMNVCFHVLKTSVLYTVFMDSQGLKKILSAPMLFGALIDCIYKELAYFAARRFFGSPVAGSRSSMFFRSFEEERMGFFS